MMSLIYEPFHITNTVRTFKGTLCDDKQHMKITMHDTVTS